MYQFSGHFVPHHLLKEAVANLRGKSDETIAEDCTAVDMTFF
jgi:hypothetical protein